MAFGEQVKYPVILAGVAVGILAGGLLLKPAQRKVEIVTESERVRLQELSQKRALEDMAQLFVRLGERVGNRVVRVLPSGPSGLVMGAPGHVVAAGFQLTDAPKVRTDRFEANATLARVAVNDLVTRLQFHPSTELMPLDLSPSEPAEGSWIVLVGRNPDGTRFTEPGIVAGYAKAECAEGVSVRVMRTGLPLSGDGAGAGAFDLDGGLAGMVIPCADRFEIATAPEIARLLGLREPAVKVLFRKAGLLLEPASEAVRNHLRLPPGLLVTAVRSDASPLGLSPGDVVQSCDGQPTATFDCLQQWVTKPPAELEVISSGGRTRVVKLAENPPSDALGVSFLKEPGVPIRSITAGGAAAKAGVRAGDNLIRVDGRPVPSETAALRLLAAGKPHFIVVRRGDVEHGFFLPGDGQ